LKPQIEPRGLDRSSAARYVGIGVTLFDLMVFDGRMPKPRIINARRVWDRRELDNAFDALPNGDDVAAGNNPFDGVSV
jgi:hypothetical protein